MDNANDPVLAQLRKLREGPGLSAGRLERAGAVMSSLGTADAQVGMTRLLEELAALGDGERVRALRVDFGLDLPGHLKRPASARETDWLGERRHGYGQVVGHAAKTLGRWSDRAIQDLRARLISDTFTGDLFVVAAVDRDRIRGCTLIRKAKNADGTQGDEHVSTEIDNSAEHDSLPCLIYGLPRDWRPASLTMAVAFRRPPYPSQAWALVADSFFALSFAQERHELTLDGGTYTCRFTKPRMDRLYAVTWRS